MIGLIHRQRQIIGAEMALLWLPVFFEVCWGGWAVGYEPEINRHACNQVCVGLAATHIASYTFTLRKWL